MFDTVPLEKQVVALFGEILADVFPNESILGGAPFNVARHLKAFGLHPVIITRTGSDALRDELLQEMDRLGLDASGVQRDPVYPTGQVLVHLEKQGHRFEIVPNQAYDHIHAGIAHMMMLSLKPALAYFGTLAQRGMESRLALDKFLSVAKCPRFLDINLRKPWYNKHTIRRSLLRADIVKINEDELDIVATYFKLNAETPQLSALNLLRQFNLKQLLITCGENGAWQINQDNDIVSTGSVSLSHAIVDTVGAGDAFASVFIIGLLNHWEPSVTLQRANQFAATLCTVRGGAPQQLDFYSQFKVEWDL